MVTRTFIGVWCATLFASWSQPALAEEPAAPPAGPAIAEFPAPAEPAGASETPGPEASPVPAPLPRLHHAPPSVAPDGAVLEIPASIDFPHLVQRALLVYRRLPRFDSKKPELWAEVEFARGAPGPYTAAIPANAVRSPGLEYAIEIEHVGGRREAAFASRQEPHRVHVSKDLMDVREEAALERLGGRRMMASAFGEYVQFGRSTAIEPDGSTEEVPDWYYRVEAAYAFRPLRVIDEFSMRGGVVRGEAPRSDPATRKVGLNYVAPSVRIRLDDAWRLEGGFLINLTEEGFALGAGGGIDIGDPYGSKLRIGFEFVDGFGTRFFSQVDIHATSRLRLSPIIEATDWPHAERFGVRLVGEAAYQVGGGFAVGVNGGYQARDAASGGPAVGLRIMQSF